MKKNVKHLMLVTLFTTCSTVFADQSGPQLEARPIVFSRVHSIISSCVPNTSPVLEYRSAYERESKLHDKRQLVYSKCNNLVLLDKVMVRLSKCLNPIQVTYQKIIRKERQIALRLGAGFIIQISDVSECLDPRYDITDQVIAELNADYSANQLAIEQEYNRLLEEAVCKLAEIKRDCKQ